MSDPARVGLGDQAGARDEPFRLEEATIEELHAAIQAGRTTCVAVVQHYIERVRAYNGVASLLVTEDGAPVPEATGAVRATERLRFPTETLKSSAVLPDLDKYEGPALEFGRMEATASIPDVAAAGRDKSPASRRGAVNAIAPSTFGVRVRSDAADFDRAPPRTLPLGRPPVWRMSRKLPEAPMRRARLPVYGRHDLADDGRCME